jgi:putative endopeptidase
MSASTANAMYYVLNNEIYIPAGILQEPIYNINMTREEKLSKIGFIIGHEITHAFDDTGSLYDEKGNVNNWWTYEDMVRFQDAYDLVAKHYDNSEIGLGLKSTGYNTLGEDIADVGSMASSLDLLRKLDNPDYKAFFLNYSELMRTLSTHDYEELAVFLDVHSSAEFRINKAFQMFEEFYEAFDIKPGDGMYVAPEDRHIIW